MSKPARPQAAVSNSTGHRERACAGVFAVAAVGLVALAATALGASSTLTLGSANSAKLHKQIVVNPQGRTLYVLTPETTKHLLCKSKECLTNWPPVLVKSAKAKLKAGAGVQGKLGVFRRSNGTFQVTLRGLPLYRYAGDSAKGQVNGEGIESFGGTWHAVGASSGTSTSKPSMPSSPPPPSSEPEPYKY
jgi:predicted lipoprotein with Yx(FWY)xxD motif